MRVRISDPAATARCCKIRNAAQSHSLDGSFTVAETDSFSMVDIPTSQVEKHASQGSRCRLAAAIVMFAVTHHTDEQRSDANIVDSSCQASRNLGPEARLIQKLCTKLPPGSSPSFLGWADLPDAAERHTQGL